MTYVGEVGKLVLPRTSCYQTQQGGHATEGDLDAILFNPVASIPKWRKSKLMRWIQNLHQSTWDHKGLFGNHGKLQHSRVTVELILVHWTHCLTTVIMVSNVTMET
jgi:hypothetical protein